MPHALVTGASSGIGEALSWELARRGYSVYLAARRIERLNALVREMQDGGHQAEAVELDVSELDETALAIRWLDARCGGLDLVVANAGVGVDRLRRPYEWEAVREALQTNFVGAGATLTAVVPQMVDRGRGHLVGIGSLASYGAVPGGVAYSAPKAGLSMMLDCLRLDTQGTGVFVTEVKLGFVDTAAIEGAPHSLPQLLSPQAAAKLIVNRLPSRPKRIVAPRMLGVAAWAGSKLPSWVCSLLFRLGGAQVER